MDNLYSSFTVIYLSSTVNVGENKAISLTYDLWYYSTAVLDLQRSFRQQFQAELNFSKASIEGNQ